MSSVLDLVDALASTRGAPDFERPVPGSVVSSLRKTLLWAWELSHVLEAGEGPASRGVTKSAWVKRHAPNVLPVSAERRWERMKLRLRQAGFHLSHRGPMNEEPDLVFGKGTHKRADQLLDRMPTRGIEST